jgi:hypothetical protein
MNREARCKGCDPSNSPLQVAQERKGEHLSVKQKQKYNNKQKTNEQFFKMEGKKRGKKAAADQSGMTCHIREGQRNKASAANRVSEPHPVQQP